MYTWADTSGHATACDSGSVLGWQGLLHGHSLCTHAAAGPDACVLPRVAAETAEISGRSEREENLGEAKKSTVCYITCDTACKQFASARKFTMLGVPRDAVSVRDSY